MASLYFIASLQGKATVFSTMKKNQKRLPTPPYSGSKPAQTLSRHGFRCSTDLVKSRYESLRDHRWVTAFKIPSFEHLY